MNRSDFLSSKAGLWVGSHSLNAGESKGKLIEKAYKLNQTQVDAGALESASLHAH